MGKTDTQKQRIVQVGRYLLRSSGSTPQLKISVNVTATVIFPSFFLVLHNSNSLK